MRNHFLLLAVAAGVLLASRSVEANAGDLYEADFASGTIFRFTRNRAGAVVKLTFRSGLDGIRGIAFDRTGNLFVAQSETIIRIAPQGETIVLASGLHGPAFLTTDSAGNVYASDRDGDVLRFTPEGAKSVYVSGLTKPSGLAFDAYGNLFVGDTSSNSIYRITPAGERTTFAAGLSNPQGMTVDRFGTLFVANGGTGTIERFNSIGSKFTFAYDLVSPIGVAIDSADNVYVAEDCGGADRIVEFTATATTGTTFASDLGCPSHLAIEPPRDPLLNVSTRAEVRSEQPDQELIGGFIIAGSKPKTVLIRALGPSLGKVEPNIPDPLPDPTLELHRTDGTITTNDDWMSTQKADIQATGLAPKDYRESAILTSLEPGSYTAIVRGKPPQPDGTALVEVYDLAVTDSTLANISTRAYVNTGDKVMIGAFIINGENGAGKVIVRALGPSLGGAGVSNVLRDPTLELRNADGTIVIENDDWADTQATEIYATGIQPPNSKESAIVATLPFGAYTAIVRGLTPQGSPEGTGVSLVEVYNIR